MALRLAAPRRSSLIAEVVVFWLEDVSLRFWCWAQGELTCSHTYRSKNIVPITQD